MLFLLLIFALVNLSTQQPTPENTDISMISVYLADDTYNAITTYTVTFSACQYGVGYCQSFPSGTILFLSQSSITWSLTNNQILPCSVDSIYWPISGVTPTCIVASNKIQISNAFPSSYGNSYSSNYVLYIQNVQNPTTVNTGIFFSLDAYTQSGVYYDSTQVIVPTTIYPANFTSCSIASSSQAISTSAQLIVTLQPKNAIPVGGYLQIYLPTHWSSDYRTTIGTGDLVYDTSSSLNCVNGVPQNPSCSFSTSSRTITISNLVSSGTLSSTFSFDFQNIITPPTTEPSLGITINSYDASGNNMDQCLTPILTVTQPGTLTSTSLTMSGVVNQFPTVQPQIKFTVNEPYTQANFMGIITIPSDFTFSVANGWPVTLSTGGGSCKSSPTGTLNGHTITISAGTLFSGTSVLTSPFTCTITIPKIFYCPPSVQTTGSFTFATYEVSGTNTYIVEQITSGLTFTPTKANMTAASVTLANYVYAATTTYTLTFNVSNSLQQTGYVTILFPQGITIAPSPTCTAQITTVNTVVEAQQNTACTVTTASGQYTLKLPSLFSTVLTASSTLQSQFIITVSSVTNAATALTTNKYFLFTTYYNNVNNSVVEDSSGLTPQVTINFQAATLTDVKVTPGSFVVGTSDVTYTITFTAITSIAAGGCVVVTFPSGIVSSITPPISCSFNVSGTAACAYTTTPLAVYNFTGFSSAVAPGTVVQLQILNSVTNPNAVNSYSSFTVYVYQLNSGSLQLMASQTSGISVSMTTPQPFYSIVITPASQTNAAITTYSFQIPVNVTHYTNSFLYITFPTTIVPPQSGLTTCATQAYNSGTNKLQSSLTCSLSSSRTVKVILTLVSASVPLVSGDTIIITVAGITSWYSEATSLPFAFTSNDGVSDSHIIQTTSSGPTITNTAPVNIITMTATPLDDSLQATTTWTISLTTISIIPNGGSIAITFPTGFTISSGSTTVSSLQNASPNIPTTNINGQILSFTVTSQSSQSLTITVTGVTNPSSSPSNNYFQVATYDSFGKIMDQAQNLVRFQSSCTLPCKTCPAGQPTQCLSCYSSSQSTLVSGDILYTSASNSCTSSCSSGYYADTTSENCLPCQSPCTKCTSTATYCTACISSTFLISASNTCSSSCAAGQYADQSTQSCQPCTSPCHYCSISSTNCTSCVSTYYLYINQCLSSCPSAAFIEDTALGTCDPCDSTCATCQTSTTYCLTCASGLYLTPTNKCISDCTTIGLFNNLALSTCVSCNSDCATCSITTNNCTSCSSTTLLLPSSSSNSHGLCLSTCPYQYYQYIQSCLSCSSPCIKCVTTSTSCTSCIVGMYLQNYQCVSAANCASGSYGDPQTGQCSSCVSPCKTCTSATACTSCTTGTYLSSSSYTCSSACNDGQYADNATLSCQSCVSPCKTCSSASSCITCATNHYLQINQCLISCPSNLTIQYAILSGPTYNVSVCQEVVISVDNLLYDCQRQIQNLSWSLNYSTVSNTSKIQNLLNQVNQLIPVPSQLVISQSNLDIGSIYTFQLNYQNSMSQNSISQFNITTSQNPGMVVQIINSKPLIFKKFQTIQMQAFIYYITCPEANAQQKIQNLTIDWNLASVNTSQVISQQQQIIDVGETISIYNIQSANLTSGQNYTCNITIQDPYDPQANYSDSVEFYISVSPLVAYIYGGDRRANIVQPLNIQGVAYDPDLLYNQSCIDFQWNCLNLNHNQPCVDQNNNLIQFNSTSSLNYPANYFQLYSTYNFSFTCTMNNKNSAAQAIIYIDDDVIIPLLQVQVPQNILVSKVNKNDDISMIIDYQGNLDQVQFAVSLNYKYYYYTKRQLYPQFAFKLWDIYTGFTRDTANLEILAIMYNPIQSQSTYSITINFEPEPGIIDIVPQSGTALQTLFQISLAGWLDEDLPLTYRYVIYLQEQDYETEIIMGENPTQRLRNTLVDFTVQQQINLFLPQAIYNQSQSQYQLLCMVSISDSLGAIANITQSVIVNPQNSANIDQYLQNISTIIQNAQYTSIDTRIQQLNIVALDLTTFDANSAESCQVNATCNGKGKCLPQQIQYCQCNNSYYLRDCSANQSQYFVYLSLQKQVYDQLQSLSAQTQSKSIQVQIFKSLSLLLSQNQTNSLVNSSQINLSIASIGQLVKQQQQMLSSLSQQGLLNQGNSQITRISQDSNALLGTSLANLDQLIRNLQYFQCKNDTQNQCNSTIKTFLGQSYAQIYSLTKNISQAFQAAQLPNSNPVVYIGTNFSQNISILTSDYVEAMFIQQIPQLKYNFWQTNPSQIVKKVNQFDQYCAYSNQSNNQTMVYRLTQTVFKDNLLKYSTNFNYSDQTSYMISMDIQRNISGETQNIKITQNVSYSFPLATPVKNIGEENQLLELAYIQPLNKVKNIAQFPQVCMVLIDDSVWDNEPCQTQYQYKQNGLNDGEVIGVECICDTLKPTTVTIEQLFSTQVLFETIAYIVCSILGFKWDNNHKNKVYPIGKIAKKTNFLNSNTDEHDIEGIQTPKQKELEYNINVPTIKEEKTDLLKRNQSFLDVSLNQSQSQADKNDISFNIPIDATISKVDSLQSIVYQTRPKTRKPFNQTEMSQIGITRVASQQTVQSAKQQENIQQTKSNQNIDEDIQNKKNDIENQNTTETETNSKKRKIFKGIIKLHDLISIFLVYDEDLSRFIRFTSYYLKQITLMAVSSVFQIQNFGIIYSTLISLSISFILKIPLYGIQKLLDQQQKNTATRALGRLLFFTIFGLDVYCTLSYAVFNGKSASDQWADTYLCFYLLETFMTDPILIVLKLNLVKYLENDHSMYYKMLKCIIGKNYIEYFQKVKKKNP